MEADRGVVVCQLAVTGQPDGIHADAVDPVLIAEAADAVPLHGFDFANARIGVRTVNLADVDGLAERLPLSARMAHALKRGPLSFAELQHSTSSRVVVSRRPSSQSPFQIDVK
jgi:hypothetical protein